MADAETVRTKVSYSVSNATGRREIKKEESIRRKHSSIAQLVEHAAVNRRVVSSSLTGGAKKQ